jgi:glutathione S-transferase
VTHPILYSFRRCPYAMRARMAIVVAGLRVTLREVSLRAKPQAMLEASPKGTVPVLILPGGDVIEQSLEIMHWALARSDPQGWLVPGDEMDELIAANDGPFKHHLDRTKYPNRYPELDPREQRAAALACLFPLEARLADAPFLFGGRLSLADIALFPFVRQFSRIDEAVWNAEPFPELRRWLRVLSTSATFETAMAPYSVWEPGQEDALFPPG